MPTPGDTMATRGVRRAVAMVAMAGSFAGVEVGVAGAQSSAPTPPPPTPTIFARRLPDQRTLVSPSVQLPRKVPTIERLSVRPLTMSLAPAPRVASAAPLLARRAAVAKEKRAPVAPVAPAAPTTQVASTGTTVAVTPAAASAPAPAPAPAPEPKAMAKAPTAPAATPAAPPQPRAGWAHITYISGSSIYLDVGTRGGLKEGSRLDVVRGSAVIGQLIVAYVSSTRSSCTVVTSTSPVEVGDSARFTPVQALVAQGARETAALDSAKARQVARSTPRRASHPIRGRLGIRYLSMQQDAGEARSTLTQPGFDLRLDGRNIGGSPFGLMVDIRAYRQNYARTSGNSLSNTTRAYQTALIWNPVKSGTRVQLGRQFSTALSPVGLFDGLALDWDRRHFSVGGFSGSQPDPRTFGYSGDVREHGGYFQLHNAPGGTSTWTMTAGGIGSYAGGQIDREFGYLQGMFNNRFVSLYTAQEIDVNRGWKANVESSSTTPTSTFAMLRISPVNAFTIFGGYDNRRSIRLYRDFLNPEIAFDDSFRQGTWGGASLYVLGHLRVDGDARTSRGGAAGAADSYTGSVHVTRITPLQLGFQLRTTRYTGELASGDLSAASIEMQPVGNFRFEVNGGRRSDTRANDVSGNTNTTWLGADADLGIGRSLYLMASTYRETGAFQRNMQLMLSLTYRF